MPDLIQALLGGLLPLIIAAATCALGWAVSRRPVVAWSAGVVLGYTAGVAAMGARGAGLVSALARFLQPDDASGWLPLVGLVAVAPAVAGAALGRRRPLQWLLAAALCVGVPLWLLWGGKYLPSQQIRDSGFATSAWGVGEAALILGSVAAMMLATWFLWERAEPTDAPRGRSLLATLALTGAAAGVGFTGTFSFAQALGALAAALGGCFIAGLLTRVKAGPEAAAGPTVMLAGSLLLLAACYSELAPLQAVGLWASITLAGGWIPGRGRLGDRAQLALRSVLCLVLLIVVVGPAGARFVETQRQQQEEAASNPYLNL